MKNRFQISGFKFQERGFAALFVTILILAVVFGIGVSIFILTHGEQKIIQNVIKSSQAYYAAEAGIEDALLMLVGNSNQAGSFRFINIGDSQVNVEISDIIGGSRTVISKGNSKNRIRKIEIAYEMNSEEVSFHYGAQVDEGGMVMSNNSQVRGNLFSNGSVYAVVGKGEITGEVILASTSTVYGENHIENIDVGQDINGNAYAYFCQNSDIGGKLYLKGAVYQNCQADEIITNSEAVQKLSLPIPEEKIREWETDASSTEIYIGNYFIPNNQTVSLGPLKIDGSLTLGNNATLVMGGTIWVTATTTLNPNSKVLLNPDSYGSKSGVLIGDGRIIIENGAALEGTGQTASYLLLISNNDSQFENEPAIFVKNNARAAIFYTTHGAITLNNNMQVREVTGYKIYIKPNAVVEYESGLASVLFTSGPGGSWGVESWEEVE